MSDPVLSPEDPAIPPSAPPGRAVPSVWIGLAWLASLAAAFYLGFSWHRPHPLTPADALPAAGEHASSARGQDSPAAASTAATGLPVSRSSAALLADLRRLAHSSSPSGRASVISTILQLDKGAVLGLIDALHAEGRGPNTGDLLDLLFQRWGMLDGPAAVIAATQERPPLADSILRSTLRGWAESDPQAALAWLRGLDNPDLYAAAVIEALVRVHGERSLDWIASNPDWLTGARFQLLSRLMETGRSREARRAAEQWFDPANPDSRHFVLSTANMMAQWDPEGALTWLEGALGRAGLPLSGLDSVIGPWVEHDPLSAIAWVESRTDLPADTHRDLLLTAFRHWQWQDDKSLHDAATWLAARPPSPADDPLRESLAESLQHRDPVAALAWAASITDPGRSAASAGWILANWQERDPAAVAAWVAEHGAELLEAVTPPIQVQSDGQTVLIQPRPSSPPAPAPAP